MRTHTSCATRRCQIWITRRTPPHSGARLHKRGDACGLSRPKNFTCCSVRGADRRRPADTVGSSRREQDFSPPCTSFAAEKMRQEVERRLQLPMVVWSILLFSSGTGFPTRHRNGAHKVRLPPACPTSRKESHVQLTKVGCDVILNQSERNFNSAFKTGQNTRRWIQRGQVMNTCTNRTQGGVGQRCPPP